MKNLILAGALVASFAAPALALPADIDADAVWTKHAAQSDCRSVTVAVELPATVTQNDVQPLAQRQFHHLICTTLASLPAGAGTAEKLTALQRLEVDTFAFSERLMRLAMQDAVKKHWPQK